MFIAYSSLLLASSFCSAQVDPRSTFDQLTSLSLRYLLVHCDRLSFHSIRKCCPLGTPREDPLFVAMARLPCGLGTTAVSLEDISRMMKGEGETLVSGAKVDGWTVGLFCTGKLEFQLRKLVVMGATLGGHWYKPPQIVSDVTVTVILNANRTPVRYGVASVPYKRGIAATWQSECNTQVVEMYKRVIVDLFSLGLDKTRCTHYCIVSACLL